MTTSDLVQKNRRGSSGRLTRELSFNFAQIKPVAKHFIPELDQSLALPAKVIVDFSVSDIAKRSVRVVVSDFPRYPKTC